MEVISVVMSNQRCMLFSTTIVAVRRYCDLTSILFIYLFLLAIILGRLLYFHHLKLLIQMMWIDRIEFDECHLEVAVVAAEC